MKYVLAFLITTPLLFAGCATNTIADVPDIDRDKLYKPQLPGISPRTMNLQVTDERRPVFHKKSEEVVKSVKDTLVYILQQSGMTVDPHSKNKLIVVIKEGYIKGQPTVEDCVTLQSDIRSQKLNYGFDAVGCYHVESEGGAHLASRIDDSYVLALNLLFENFDKKLSAK